MKNGLVIDEEGDKYWYQNDQLHRTDGPAIEYSNGTKYWYQHGQLHRDDGPAIEGVRKYWYQNGKRHRLDGPAVEGPGYTAWWVNGECHRVDGPAVEYSNGNKFWYLNGDELSQTEWELYQMDQFTNHRKAVNK